MEIANACPAGGDASTSPVVTSLMGLGTTQAPTMPLSTVTTSGANAASA